MASQRSRRVTLPGAAELFFRQTSPPDTVPEPAPAEREPESPPEAQRQPTRARAPQPDPGPKPRSAPRPSGRKRHDEKITVYISAAELLALEQARLTLRAEYGLAVDRGRIVREAVAVLLADLEEHGADSTLVRRLSEN